MGTKTIIFIAILAGVIVYGFASAIVNWFKRGKNVSELKSVLIGVVIIIAVISIPIYLLISNKSITVFKSRPAEPKVYTNENRKITAYVCAKFKVEEYLKAPSTAKFQSYPDALVTINGSYYYVNSYVDAQNGFGAMIRTKFICKALNPNPEISDCETVTCAYQ